MRAWEPEQQLIPRAEFNGTDVTIHNVRHFRRGPGEHVRPSWEARTYDLDDVASVWYVLTPFSRDRRGPAHAFVSFGFDDGRHLSISVEARREEGEQYSLLRGMLKRFEVMYVVGDERDLIHLRVLRGDDVYVYPMRASRQEVRTLLTDMLARVNALHRQPEFYGTLRNNCTTNLLRHVNAIAMEPIPYGRRILLPGHSDAVAHERGLIDTELSLDAARERFMISERALKVASNQDYSRLIRAFDGP
ncbi:MAG: DUF4105 domain-containing protein [Gemmatimonadetes bacterium]|nr:DUF4105 domain-containing protein [Gemmatimonadota bacterium]